MADSPPARPVTRLPEAVRWTTPTDRLIRVGIAVSAATTWIDFAGPLAVFETYHFDATDRKHKPRFKPFLVSEKIEPLDNLAPDATFDATTSARKLWWFRRSTARLRWWRG